MHTDSLQLRYREQCWSIHLNKQNYDVIYNQTLNQLYEPDRFLCRDVQSLRQHEFHPRSGINFINILRAAFTRADPKKR